jgi:hypothetical protein
MEPEYLSRYGYGLDGPRSIPGRGRFFSSPQRPGCLGPTQPHIQWVPGALSPRAKRPGREADHSPYSADVKNDGAIHSSVCLHGIVLN